MKIEKIQFNYLEDGVVRTGLWEGDPSEAIEAAVEFLGAEYLPEEEAWVYTAQESGEEILVDEYDLLKAGAAILAGAEDWHSVWCAEHGTPVGR